MKTLKTSILLFLFLSTKILIAQVEVEIQSLEYTNNGEPTVGASNCGMIDLKSSTNTTINFGINLSKPNGQVVGFSTIYVYTKKSSFENRLLEWQSAPIPESFWNQPSSGDDTYSTTASFSISSNDFDITGGILFAVFKTSGNIEYPSCSYDIEKDPIPTFELETDSYSIYCGSTEAYSFTVNNVYNSPGTLTYNWNVGSGWKRDGTPVSGSFSTTTNSITLVPSSTTVLPSNVSVTSILDGETYPTETATVTRSSYNPAYQISGPDAS